MKKFDWLRMWVIHSFRFTRWTIFQYIFWHSNMKVQDYIRKNWYYYLHDKP